MKINPDYKLYGSVLGVLFEQDVYSEDGDTERDIVYNTAYTYSEGNFGCDCNKMIFAGIEGEYGCGDNIKYDSLTLVYKNERVIDLLKEGWFKNDSP